jgi:hypothetical protein
MQDITIDKALIGLSSALILTGVVVLGLVETLAGQPYGAAPMTNEAGEILATPLVDPNIRTLLVILGVAVLGLRALVRMAQPVERDTSKPTGATAD